MTGHVSTVIKLTPIDKLLREILRNHGEKGFCEKLKNLKSWAFQLVGGNKTFTMPWFRISKLKGYSYPTKFRAIFRPLIFSLLNKDYQGIRRNLSFLNVYHTIQGPILKDRCEVTDVVYADVATNTDPKFDRIFDLVLNYVKDGFHDHRKGFISEPVGSAVAITPLRNGTYAQWVAAGAPGESMDRPFRFLNPKRTRSLLTTVPDVPLWQGNLAIIGDSGGKNRLILVGHPVVQTALKPLQRYLLSMLRELGTDCTFDQSRGHDFIIGHQLQGRHMYSVDLKDATWNFPMTLQMRLLKAIGAGQLEKYFRLPVSDNGRLVEVRKGQAMGLNPSFPLFSLTHNLVTYGLSRYLGLDQNSFRILGDDVIFSDIRLRDLYLDFCRNFEIPISHHKCLNGTAAEFAGKIFLDGKDVTPIKWRSLGREQLPALYSEYRKVLGRKDVKQLISDKFAYLVLGGLSHHAHGLGISGFDRNNPVTNRHLRIRSGLVDSLYENLQRPTLIGGQLKLKQEELEFEPVDGSDFLRELGDRLDAGIHPHPEYGLLPYLGNPVSIARQLGISVPLLPDRTVKSTVYWGKSIHLNYKYYKQGDGNELAESIRDLRRLRREIVEKSEEADQTSQSPQDEESSRYFYRTLEGRFGSL
jgi:hypothetical protein